MHNPGSELYSSFASNYDNVIQDNIYNALFERPSTWSLLPQKLNGLNVLDAGCGPGVYAQKLIQQGAKVTAVDLSEQMIELVRKKLGDKVVCYSHDLSTPLAHEKNQSFDLIVCPVTIHYIEKLKLFYTEMYRLLKPGGSFVFSTHHPFVDFEHSQTKNYFVQENMTQSWNTIGRATTVNFYRRSFEALLSPALNVGFQLDKISEKGVPSEEIKSRDPETWDKINNRPQFVFIRLKRF